MPHTAELHSSKFLFNIVIIIIIIMISHLPYLYYRTNWGLATRIISLPEGEGGWGWSTALALVVAAAL